MSDQEERQFNGLTIRIDRTRCIGSGNCVKVNPKLFELDDSNIVTFTGDPAIEDRDRAVEACDVCPVDALIATIDGKQVVPQP